MASKRWMWQRMTLIVAAVIIFIVTTKQLDETFVLFGEWRRSGIRLV